MRMQVPSDLPSRIAPLIGTPFVPKGDTPKGWDCRGLARWCLGEFCGVHVPDYQDLYRAEVVSARGGAVRAALLAQGLAQWRAVPPQAGAVALLTWLGQAGHVGFMLAPRLVLHADAGIDTVLLDLDEPGSRYGFAGAFVPAFVSDLVTA